MRRDLPPSGSFESLEQMATSSLGIARIKTNMNVFGHTFLPGIAHVSAMNKSTRPAAPHPEKIGPSGIHTRIVKTIATMIGTLCACASPLLAADPSSVVHIPDPVLRAAIGATLGKPAGEITAADMESLTILDVSRS